MALAWAHGDLSRWPALTATRSPRSKPRTQEFELMQTSSEDSQIQVQQAVAEAARQRALRSHAPRTAPAVASNETAAEPPSYALERVFREPVGRWLRVKQSSRSGEPDQNFERPRAIASLALLDNALHELGRREGERASAAR